MRERANDTALRVAKRANAMMEMSEVESAAMGRLSANVEGSQVEN